MDATIATIATSTAAFVVAIFGGTRAWLELRRTHGLQIDGDTMKIAITAEQDSISLDDLTAAVVNDTNSVTDTTCSSSTPHRPRRVGAKRTSVGAQRAGRATP